MAHPLATDAGFPTPSNVPDWIALVREKVEGLRYGIVQLVVCDGRVMPSERTAKTRRSGPGGRRPAE